MIDLGRPALHAEGVTVFPDHAEPGRFHYLPDRPRLRMRADGTPELALLKYRLDPALHHALGAGMLSLTVDLGVDDEVLARVRARLRRQFALESPPTLAPVVADAGAVELVLIDRVSDKGDDKGAGFGLVPRILGAGAPSLYGDNAATFLAVLSAEGVALVEGALRGGGLPVGVVYRLQVLGIRPALRAEITARWRDVYHFYENRLHGGKLLLAVDVGATMEQLVHDEAITIHVDELLPAEERDPALQRALDQAQRYVTEELFQPTLAEKPPPVDEGDGAMETIGRAIKDLVGFFALTYSLRDIDRDELKTMEYRLQAASAEKLTLAPQGTVALLAEGRDIDRLITIVEPAAAAEMAFDVGAALDLAREGIDHLSVELGYGARTVELVLDAATPRRPATVWFDEALGPSVKLRYRVAFVAGDGASEVPAAAETTTSDRVIRIDPRALYRRPEVRAVATGVPFARFPQVIVDLRADDAVDGWSFSRTLVLDAAHPEAAWSVRARPDGDVTFRRRLRYVDARGEESVVDWDTVPPGILVVGDPFPDVVDVRVIGSARFDSEVKELDVELRPLAHPAEVALRVLTGAQPTASWSFPVARDEQRTYEYRVTVLTVRGESREGRWLPSTDLTLTVGEGIARLRTVQLMFVGRSARDLGLLGVKVRFSFEDREADLHAEAEQLVTDTVKERVQWTYPVADASRQAYQVQLTLIHADGRMEARDPLTSADLLLVVPLN